MVSGEWSGDIGSNQWGKLFPPPIIPPFSNKYIILGLYFPTMRVLNITLLLLLIFDGAYSQNKSAALVDKRYFKVDTTIKQNNSRFYFWRGKADTTYKRIIIERISNHTDKVIFDDFVRDGYYRLFDMNDDGFLDFVTYYHDYDEIRFFNPSINRFMDTAIDMPQVVGEIPTPTGKLYYSYTHAAYGDPYPYSTLFKYKGTVPVFIYSLKYITKEMYWDAEGEAEKIYLYQVKNGSLRDSVLVKNIKMPSSGKFAYGKYWRGNYTQLLGFR